MINNKQRNLTKKLLLDYYMVSSKYENHIYCDKPFYLDGNTSKELQDNAVIIDKLNNRILSGISTEYSDVLQYLEDFPLKKEIFQLQRKIPYTFWTRFDGFVKENGEVFFSEFNYDKPCGQREIISTGEMKAINNMNKNFLNIFIKSLKSVVQYDLKDKLSVNIGILVDPAHYEEAHVSYLLKEIIEKGIRNANVISFGPQNIIVDNDKVKAFGDYIDIIIKLYPTEYLYEVKNIEKVLDVYEKGNVVFFNDPRSIVLQAKSYFAYLWELVDNKPYLLSKEETIAIKSSIPKTMIYTEEKYKFLLENKDRYLLKPLLGRYSEDIFIGLEYSIEEWMGILEYVKESNKKFVIQEFFKIKKEKTHAIARNLGTMPVEGYGNFGVFINNNKFSGICLRWSTDYVTRDETTWITPVGVKNKPYKVMSNINKNKKVMFKKVRDRAILEYSFTGSYNGSEQYISVDYLEIKKEVYDEILHAARECASLLKKTQKVIIDNIDIFKDIMGFDRNIANLINKQYTDALCLIGRMDIVVDNEGNIKILEFNSETPAGLVEAIGIQQIIKEEVDISSTNLNENLKGNLKENIIRIINDYTKHKPIETIGILSTTYFEDWYNTEIIYNVFKELGYNVIMGSINDTKVENGYISIYGTKLDAVYRYYPLDWIAEDNVDYLNTFVENTLSINPPHTIITQNKSIFAVIYELKKQGFYTEAEKTFIEKYIPKTYLQYNNALGEDFCIKHILSREGNDIELSYNTNKINEENYIYQERVDICEVNLEVDRSYKISNEIKYPILGIYIVDTNPCGIYTRVGELITNKWSSFLPTFIEG